MVLFIFVTNFFVMSITEIREKIHQLVDTASDGYLVEVLDLLEQEHSSSSYKYSKEDIERFNKQAELYEQGKLKTYTFEEVKAMIKTNYSNKNAL